MVRSFGSQQIGNQIYNGGNKGLKRSMKRVRQPLLHKNRIWFTDSELKGTGNGRGGAGVYAKGIRGQV